ncbi:MAG: tetratricopeptide repeat protein [Burkholderiales bacterium]|nr:tetratricopeptide repeat protein [Anaerolineae bacterium]
MTLFDQIKQKLGISTQTAVRTEIIAMRDALETGRRSKRAEDFDSALSAFNRAMQVAQLIEDAAAMAIIALHQADILISQNAWAAAEELLQSVYSLSQKPDQGTQLAYTLSTWGTLAQARGDWNAARDYYERGLEVARKAQAEGAEGRALGHLADTYLNEGNASYAVHLLRESLPHLNSTGDVELSSYFVGQLGAALIASGQDVEGSQLLNRALRLAEQMHYRQYERQWSLAIGARAAAEGRFEDAYTRYQQGLELFKPDAPMTTEYILAFCSMSRVCMNLQQYDEALQYAQKAVDASGLLWTMESSIWTTAATLARGALGMALHAVKRSAEAIPHLNAAADLQQQLIDSGQQTAVIDILRSLASAQAETSTDITLSQATYARALEAAKRMDAHLEAAETHRDFGHLYAKHRQLTAAIQEWQAALAIYETGKHHAQVARLYCDIADARRQLGQGQRAMKDFEHALMILSSVNDQRTRGVVLSNAATAYVEQGDIDSAESFFNEAITIASTMGDRGAEATRRGNYGWFLLSTGRARQAIAALERALQISQILNLDLQSAVQTDNLGLAYDALNDYPTAIHYHQKALELIRRNGSNHKSGHWEAMFKANYAATLLTTGQIDEAAALFEETLTVGRSSGSTELIVRGLLGLAKIALQRGDAESTVTGIQEALTLAKRADLRRWLAEGYAVQSEQQSALGQPGRAAELWDEAQRLFTVLQSPQAGLHPAWLKHEAPLQDTPN